MRTSVFVPLASFRCSPALCASVWAALTLGVTARAGLLPLPDVYNTTPVSLNSVSATAPLSGAWNVPVDPSNTEEYGQCTYWAAEKRPDIEHNAISKYGYPQYDRGAFNWNSDAALAGYRIDHTPAAGDVAVYPPNYTYSVDGGEEVAGPGGHVAYVERVNSDASFVVSEMNWQLPLEGEIGYVPAAAAAGIYFIHLPGSVATVVTLTARTTTVADQGEAIQVTATRTGDLSSPLTVYYTTKGTAVGGINYRKLAGSVVIPAGSATAAIKIRPMNDHSASGSHVLRIALVAGGGYIVGAPAAVAIRIRDGN